VVQRHLLARGAGGLLAGARMHRVCPDGFAIWEALRAELDKRIKKTGARNAYFPLFIPKSFLEKEAQHVEGFAPEVAVVTHGGGKELEEPLIVAADLRDDHQSHVLAVDPVASRSADDAQSMGPTSCAGRCGPGCSWRTTEFLWQEGHTAHATREEAERETLTILEMYRKFVEEFLAIPLIVGRTSAAERFRARPRLTLSKV